MTEEAKVDEYVFVLVAGLLMIIVMLFGWGVPTEEENVTAAVPVNVTKHIRMGDFSVSYLMGSDVLLEEEGIEVRKGLFEESSFRTSARIEDLESVTGGFVVLEVLNTNSVGNLRVKVNNVLVFDEMVQPGQIKVSFGKELLREYNVLEISTSRPSWKFWMSSIYGIEGVKLGIDVLGRVEVKKIFQMSEDWLRGFVSGKMIFSLERRSGVGDLMIEMNGRQIFKGIPSQTFSLQFDAFEVGLRKGGNEIAFSSEMNATYDISNAEIVIVYEEVRLSNEPD